MHIEFNIEDSKIRYETGDHLAVYPVNNEQLVNKIGEQCDTNLDTIFTLTNTDGELFILMSFTFSLYILFVFYFFNFNYYLFYRGVYEKASIPLSL